jgi:hypothetical protein
VRTLTVPLSNPNGRYPGLGSVVIWDPELSADLWDRINKDESLMDTVKASAQATTKPKVVDKFKTHTAAENPCSSKA